MDNKIISKNSLKEVSTPQDGDCGLWSILEYECIHCNSPGLSTLNPTDLRKIIKLELQNNEQMLEMLINQLCHQIHSGDFNSFPQFMVNDFI